MQARSRIIVNRYDEALSILLPKDLDNLYPPEISIAIRTNTCSQLNRIHNNLILQLLELLYFVWSGNLLWCLDIWTIRRLWSCTDDGWNTIFSWSFYRELETVSEDICVHWWIWEGVSKVLFIYQRSSLNCCLRDTQYGNLNVGILENNAIKIQYSTTKGARFVFAFNY